ncbi:MAG: hypothetical protein EPN94_08800 [Nitrospirae bacterium]|nr:MAG: hypothetical protein EPN94_08800 [Nitrospirota bacterium]
MDLKTVKDTIGKKFEALSQREKVIFAITLAAAVFVVFHVMLYSPASKKVKLKRQTLQNIKKEIEAINLILSSQAVVQKAPVAEKITLPEAENLSGMLAAISREATMARVDFISISPEGFEYKDRFIEMKVKIELRVRSRELYDFLKNIETRHKLFMVHDLKFETNSALYPAGIAILKAGTYLRKKQ